MKKIFNDLNILSKREKVLIFFLSLLISCYSLYYSWSTAINFQGILELSVVVLGIMSGFLLILFLILFLLFSLIKYIDSKKPIIWVFIGYLLIIYAIYNILGLIKLLFVIFENQTLHISHGENAIPNFIKMIVYIILPYLLVQYGKIKSGKLGIQEFKSILVNKLICIPEYLLLLLENFLILFVFYMAFINVEYQSNNKYAVIFLVIILGLIIYLFMPHKNQNKI